MRYWRSKPKSMMGYVRVSTKRQAEQGQSLMAQTDVLLGYASQNDFDLPAIYADEASASGKLSYVRRGDLQSAARRAIELGLPLLVQSIDRLSRNVSLLDHSDFFDLEIFSVADGGRVSKKLLRAAIRKAQRRSEDLSHHAIDSWAAIGKTKRQKSHTGPEKSLRRRGTVSNMLRRDLKVKEIADYLENNNVWKDVGARRLSKHLNEISLLNLTSERENVRKPWTKDSLNGPLVAARKLLASRAALDMEEFEPIVGFDDIYFK